MPITSLLKRYPLSWVVFIAHVAVFAGLNHGGALPPSVQDALGFGASAPLWQWPYRSVLSDFLYFGVEHFVGYGLPLCVLTFATEQKFGTWRALALFFSFSLLDDILFYLLMVKPFAGVNPAVFEPIYNRRDVGGSYIALALFGINLHRLMPRLRAPLFVVTALAFLRFYMLYATSLLGLVEQVGHVLWLNLGFAVGALL